MMEKCLQIIVCANIKKNNGVGYMLVEFCRIVFIDKYNNILYKIGSANFALSIFLNQTQLWKDLKQKLKS